MGSEAGGSAAGGGRLLVAATPLGHLGEISPRLAAALAGEAALFAEDTRRARILLSHLGLRRPVRALHAHNERARTAGVLALLAAGQDCVLMTDAGTPAVSDPGAEVVAAAHRAGRPVAPLAGPSALAAALSVAGFPATPAGVWFVGFLATRGGPRARQLAAATTFLGTWVAFESPRRVGALVAALARASPDREAVLCRELTKLHEEVRRRPLAQLADELADTAPRGEITLVVGPPHRAGGAGDVGPAAAPAARPAGPDDAELARALARCRAAGMRASEAARTVATVLGAARGRTYRLAQAAGGEPDGPEG